MLLTSVAALLPLLAPAVDAKAPRHAAIAMKRQATTPSPASGTTTAPASGTTVSGSSSSVSGSAAANTSVNIPAPLTGIPAPQGSNIPSLTALTAGMVSGTTDTVTQTFAPGSQPTNFQGQPQLPNPAFVFKQGVWPQQDKVVDPTSSQVQQWMQELNGFNIPNLDPTVDGTCASSPQLAADAANRGWWSCGGYTRPVDIVACPDKLHWGVSFDDGPAPYTQKLLNYINSKNIKATFFVVGSRVIERPNVLIEEYENGHEISVHTWSHPHLTMLSTAQIVGELGWTREAIKQVLGVTPTTFRPPYGDIDDRVRAIALAMGLIPIIWTRSPQGAQFDTNDWQIPANVVTPLQSFASFQYILNNATQLSTGFVVLQHDLFEVTVDMAIGYTLPAAQSFQPQLTMSPIGQCNNIPANNMYAESNTNKSFPYTNHTNEQSGGGSNAAAGLAPPRGAGPLAVAVLAALVGAVLF